MPLPGENEPVMRLPHPYLTPYYLAPTTRKTAADDGEDDQPQALFQLRAGADQVSRGCPAPPEALHSPGLFFTEPRDVKSGERPPESNNTAWGRARRSPRVVVVWDASAPDSSSSSTPGDSNAPTLAQAWLLIYVLFTLRPSMEGFRLSLQPSSPAGGGGSGGSNDAGKQALAAHLKTVLLAVDHPIASGLVDELLVLRSTFWQGAGSPFGPRPAWLPEDRSSFAAAPASASSPAPLPKPLSAYPPTPYENAMSSSEPGSPPAWHPLRPAKPRPGSVIYSRWIPHLRENFSMVALDWRDEAHLGLFHAWQNDPRVSQGWNETGTLDQHREYLRRAHDDPHQVTILARFDDVCFAYFEVYWGKEDRLGAYYGAGDFDRGRHSLVGDVRFRGPHRVTAWWSSLMHYMFLDEPRTGSLVGEPKHTNSSVLAYDMVHGFGLDKLVDLPHKRSALVRCSRERFFQLAPLGESDKVIGGTHVGLLPKL